MWKLYFTLNWCIVYWMSSLNIYINIEIKVKWAQTQSCFKNFECLFKNIDLNYTYISVSSNGLMESVRLTICIICVQVPSRKCILVIYKIIKNISFFDIVEKWLWIFSKLFWYGKYTLDDIKLYLNIKS